MAFDIEAIKKRIEAVADGVFSKLEQAAHTKAAEAIEAAVKDILAVVPDGPEIEAIIEQLVAIAESAHNAIHNAAAAPVE